MISDVGPPQSCLIEISTGADGVMWLWATFGVAENQAPAGVAERVGELTISREAAGDSRCARTVVLGDRSRVYVTADAVRGTTTDLCAVADAGTQTAVAALSGGDLPRRDITGPPNALTRLDVCALLDQAALTRVLLVVNDALYRCGLRAILKRQPDLEIVGEAHDCCEAAERLRHVDASVVLLDPRGQGTGPVAAIRTLSCRPLLVLASPGGEPLDEATALRAGANGLLLNTADPGELAAALRVAVAGYTLLLPSTADQTGREEEFHETIPEEVPKELLNLTLREQQVFCLVASGFSNAEIAGMLMLGESTIKSHVQHLLTKLNIPNRVHAVIFAYQHSLVKGMRAFSPLSGSVSTRTPPPESGRPTPVTEMRTRLRSRIRPMDESRTGRFSYGTTPSPSRYSSTRRKTHSCPTT